MRGAGLLLGLLGAILLLAGWWFFFISPRNAQIDDFGQQLATAQTEESALLVQIRTLEEIRESEAAYLGAIVQLEQLIPQQPMLDQFIEQIFALTNSSGVELQTLSPSLPAQIEATALRQIATSIQIEGDFFEVIGFLFALNDMERLVRIDSISVASGSDEEGRTLLSVSLELRLFTLADLVAVQTEFPSPGGPEDPNAPLDDFPEAGDDPPTTTESPSPAAPAGDEAAIVEL